MIKSKYQKQLNESGETGYKAAGRLKVNGCNDLEGSGDKKRRRGTEEYG